MFVTRSNQMLIKIYRLVIINVFFFEEFIQVDEDEKQKQHD